jgi:hypothetical protein
LPTVEQNLTLLGHCNIFSCIDPLMGFHQLEMSEESIIKTACSSPFGQLGFLRVLLGLTSSPGAFMRAVDAAVKHLTPGRVVCYLDDLICPTYLVDEADKRLHFEHLGEVLDALIQSGYTARCDKVHVGMRDILYLGFLVGAYGTRPSPDKLKAILDLTWETMRTDQSLAARFAGMIGYYHKYIPHLHSLLGPFYDLKPTSVKSAPLSLRLHAIFVHLAEVLWLK